MKKWNGRLDNWDLFVLLSEWYHLTTSPLLFALYYCTIPFQARATIILATSDIVK